MAHIGKIDRLFRVAKRSDEFEYVCALLRVRGSEDAGWDPLQETTYLYEDLTGLMTAPLNHETRVRLALLLYCHITEAEAVYHILYNMLSITQGCRYNSFPFNPFVTIRRDGTRREPATRTIVNEIQRYSSEIGMGSMGDVLKHCINHELRNAFFHSDYTLHDGEFRSKGSWFTHRNGIRSQALNQEELNNIVGAGITFFRDFMTVYQRHRDSYTSDKVVQGRFSHDESYVPITILADENYGLHGFTTSFWSDS